MVVKRMKNKAITWVVIGLMGLCVLITAILPKMDRNAAVLPENPAISSSTPLPAVNVPSPAGKPSSTHVENTPTSTQLFLYDCIPAENGVEMGNVTRVIDGDTIHVDINGKDYSVRYIGIDAPEMDSNDPLAGEAKQKNADLTAGKNVILVRDVSETDSFDRLLRYVLVGNTFVNLELVQGGFAVVKAYPPDTACHETFNSAAPAVRSNEITLPTDPPFSTLEFTPTQSVQATPGGGCPNGCTAESAGCSIKGNISMDGEKIYHLPGMRYYTDTVINPAKGERWFCTEDEASANGWRRSKR